MDEGTNILATMDGKLRTISESSIRRNLKLNDEEGISTLPDAELFENLTLMGYNILPNQQFTFQKGQFSHQWKYQIHTIMQCLSPKSTGFNEFSSNIAIVVICLATNIVYNFSKMIFNGMVRNVNNKVSKFLMYPGFLTKCLKMGQFGKIAHTHMYAVPFHTRKGFTTLRVNSPSFSGQTVLLFDAMLVTLGEGAGTPTEPHYTPSPEAQQSPHTAPSSPSLPPATTEPIPTVTRSEIPTLRDDSQGEAFPTVSGLEAGQDRENIIKTSALPYDSTPGITSLATDEGNMEISNLKASIKMLEDKDIGGAEPSGEDATIKGRSLETEEETAIEKSTGRRSNDTEELINVLTSMDAATILTIRVQAVSVHPVIKIPTVDVPTGSVLVPTAKSDTPKKKKLQEQIDVHVAREIEEQMAREDQRRNEQIIRDAKITRIHAEKELQMLIDGLDRNNKVIARHLHEYEQAAAELTIREKIELINELVKYQDHHVKILKYQAQQSKPLSKKQQREFYMSKQIEDFVPMASKEEGERMKRKGLNTLIEDLIQLWTLVKETLSIKQATSDKDKELWVELKRLFEPDVEDQLWIHTQALMYDPVEWRLYDSCGVHYVLTRDQEIFMLVEKDYPLRKGLAIVMISNKLQTEMASKIAAQDLEITSLKAMIKLLEDKDGGGAEPSKEDATIKGRSLETGEETAVEKSTERGSNDTEELVNVLTSLDATSILTSRVQVVSVPLLQKLPLKPLSKKQQREFYMSVLKSHSGWKTKHFKGMTLEEIREKFILVWKQIEDFVPMAFKEEEERFKRKGLRLEHTSAKKMKIDEDVSEEDLKQMMQLVLVEEHFDKEDLIQLWTLEKETLSIRQSISDKEKEQWVELKRLFEPDVKDQLWTHTQALMHDPVEWRLYDSCGVHYMLSRDQEIFMLVEKDYPLRKGLEIVMISNKLQLENYSQMAND
nr:hypothetical protein [Tanacetum cinerariifolium]